MKKLLVSIILAVLLTGGCATTMQPSLNTTTLQEDVITISNSYVQVKNLLNFKQAENNIFTPLEWDKLVDVDASINLLLMKYEMLLRLNTTSFNMYDVSTMWTITKNSYSAARSVVIAHEDAFDEDTKILFESFDRQAIATSKQISVLIDANSSTKVNTTLMLIADVLGLAIKILSLAVVVL